MGHKIGASRKLVEKYSPISARIEAGANRAPRPGAGAPADLFSLDRPGGARDDPRRGKVRLPAPGLARLAGAAADLRATGTDTDRNLLFGVVALSPEAP
jgi:hypothetical protein